MVIAKPDYSALKVIEFTYSASKEELLAVPEILPTTEPEIGQVKYTVAETDLPLLHVTTKPARYGLKADLHMETASTADRYYDYQLFVKVIE